MFESKTEKRLSFGPLTLRYVFFAFVALMIGVAAAEFFITEKEWITYTVFGILSAFAVLAFILGGLKARSVALVCLIACLTGFLRFFYSEKLYRVTADGLQKGVSYRVYFRIDRGQRDSTSRLFKGLYGRIRKRKQIGFARAGVSRLLRRIGKYEYGAGV